MNTPPVVVDGGGINGTQTEADAVPWRALSCAIMLVAAADPLLFDRQPGISVVLFLLLLAASIPIANLWPAPVSRIRLAGAAMVVVCLLPLAETFSALSLSIALTGFAAGVLVAGGETASTAQWINRILRLLCSGPVRLPAPSQRWCERSAPAGHRPSVGSAGWCR